MELGNLSLFPCTELCWGVCLEAAWTAAKQRNWEQLYDVFLRHQLVGTSERGYIFNSKRQPEEIVALGNLSSFPLHGVLLGSVWKPDRMADKRNWEQLIGSFLRHQVIGASEQGCIFNSRRRPEAVPTACADGASWWWHAKVDAKARTYRRMLV